MNARPSHIIGRSGLSVVDRTIDGVELVSGTVAAAALLGALVGLVAGLSFRLSERDRTRPVPEPPRVLPPGVEAVLSSLRASYVVVDEALRVVKASPSAYALGIVRRNEIAPDRLAALVSAVAREGDVRQVELMIPRGRDGTQRRYVDARVAPLAGELVVAVLEDRTAAHRVDQVRRDFVANVSHELKTPVGALSLLAEAVQDASDDPQAVRRFAQRMQGEATRLTRLVQEIIDLSRLQYDDPIVEPDVVSLDAVVAEALDRCRVDAAAKGIRLVSGGERGLTVLGDGGQLVTALGNLVENAVNYSPERTRVAVGVRHRADPAGGRGAGEVVELSVADQGIGIPAADRDRIFERFYRVDPARSRRTGGTGLGLSIVKHIAASHGGGVSVWSVPGAGSTFTLRLPLHHRPAPASRPAATTDVPSPEAAP